MPKVSVIIPTYNCAEYLKEAIDSVLAQTFTDYEIIVVDDGSTDGTAELLQGCHVTTSPRHQIQGDQVPKSPSHQIQSDQVARLPGHQLKYIRREHKGVSATRNIGIKSAQGEYIAFLDADDVWFPEKLEKQIEFLNKHPEAHLVCCDLETFDETGPLKGTYFERMGFRPEQQILKQPFKLMLEKNFIQPSSALIKKECFEKAGFFDEKLALAEDKDFFIRVAAYYKIGVIPEKFAKRRIYSKKTRSSSIEMDTQRDNSIYVLDKAKGMFPDIISRERISVNDLKAETYFEYGYMNFARGEFTKARPDFKKSLRGKGSLKGFMYYTATFLSPKAILAAKKFIRG